MSEQNATTVDAVQKLAEATIKLAKAAKDRSDKTKSAAAVTVDPTLVEKAASALIESGWTKGDRKDELVRLLNDPTQVLTSLTNLAEKSAAVIEELRGDGRLANGKAVPANPTTVEKKASVGTESAADQAFTQKMLRYKVQRG